MVYDVRQCLKQMSIFISLLIYAAGYVHWVLGTTRLSNYQELRRTTWNIKN